MKTRKILLLLTGLMVTPSFADTVIIANINSPITTLTEEEIARIYLKKLKTLHNNLEVFPISQSENNTMEETFYSQVAKKDRIQLRSYWARLLFTGKDNPPKDGKNSEGVKVLVLQHPGALGLIDDKDLDKRFKVVFRLK